jgi:hypothetical protein
MNAHRAAILRTMPRAHTPSSCWTAPAGTARERCASPAPFPSCRPPCAPEPDRVKNVRADLRANHFAIAVVETCADILARCCDAWNFFFKDSATVRSITRREYAIRVKG